MARHEQSADQEGILDGKELHVVEMVQDYQRVEHFELDHQVPQFTSR